MRVERDQLILVGGLVLVAAAVIVLGYLPMRAQRAQAMERIQTYQTQLRIDLADANKKPRLEGELAALRAGLEGPQRDVPAQNELGKLLNDLSSEMEHRLMVTDKEVQMLTVMQGADYHVLPVTLRFGGSFATAYGFVRQIESMPRLIRIDRLVLTGCADGSEKLTARIELSTFFTAEEAGNP